MTNHPEDPNQSGVSPLGPTVRRQKGESAPLPADLPPAPPFSRSSRRDVPQDNAGEIELTEESAEQEFEGVSDEFSDDHFGEMLMTDDLGLTGDDNQVDELPWLADLPEAGEAPEAERDAPEWLDWLDGVDGIDEGGAVESVSEPEAHRPDLPPVESPVEPPPSSATASDDALIEIAERLEKIAASLRTGSAGTLLSEQSTDPLAALVAGYALGYARRRGEGTDH